MMKEKAKTMVRQRNSERKKAAVRQWDSLAKPKPLLQVFFSCVGGAVPTSTPASPLFKGSTSVAWSVDSIAPQYISTLKLALTQQEEQKLEPDEQLAALQ